jgi:hypothetical protein
MGLLNLFRLQWDRGVALLATAIGLLSLLLGYIGVSGTPHVAEQLPYMISGGLFGIFCLTVAAIAWISADLRDEWRELHEIRELLETGGPASGGLAARQDAVADTTSAGASLNGRREAVLLHRESSGDQEAAPPRRRRSKATAVADQ